MAKFRIQPHGRLQEWVAEEQGYFKDEGLDYEFTLNTGAAVTHTLQTTEEAPREVLKGAFEAMEAGRACEVSSACHWAVNMASSGEHGQMWGHAYSVTPSGIYVPPESSIRTPRDLAGVEVGVGYHSGSHFSALQALEAILPREQIKFRFIGLPLDRMRLLLERQTVAANVFGTPRYVLEQQGFRKIVDTTFMIGFLISGDADKEDVGRYFTALRRAQKAIDLAPERYKHYFLKELPEKYHGLVDISAFGTGERLIFEEYTREDFEQTHRWMESWQLFSEEQAGHATYE
ncbi:MAG: ABC transporter substrate-binding protein, partial [Dehalococcoidia bacterium]